MKPICLETQILNKYKTIIFRELIRLVWNENLDDIDKIPKNILKNIKGKSNQYIDESTVVNLIRIIIGLSPVEETENLRLRDMIYESMNLEEIDMPIISIIDDACKYCDNTKYECLIKNKHINCNKQNTCSACGECIYKCKLGAISDKIEFIPIINMLKNNKYPVYAIVAPAFTGQFGEDVSAGRLRGALKSIGFKDMIEVALAADILTVKEAYNYQEHIKKNNKDYFITSCCCPVWVSLIKSKFPEIANNISPSVSPMIASGRIIKILNPSAKVVFIGPCIAKKKEAKSEGLKGAVDFVLTFQELDEIFKALDVNLQNMKEDNRLESSYCGKIYAKSGGVSKSIEVALKEINKDIEFNPISFQGSKECIRGLEKIINKEIDATFIEGMGCKGGCIGGPKNLIPLEEGIKHMDKYLQKSELITPFDNLNVAQFLLEIGIKKVDELGDKDKDKIQQIFSRNIEK